MENTLRSTVRGFRWPNKSHTSVSRGPLPPVAEPTIDEIHFRFKAKEKAKQEKLNDSLAAQSAAESARRCGERDLPDPGEITVEENRKGQKYWEFGH